ncbi:MAG: hypothetical protein ACI8XM_000329 [Haloarculaceae archaeon]|jgi:hypothetical protein
MVDNHNQQYLVLVMPLSRVISLVGNNIRHAGNDSSRAIDSPFCEAAELVSVLFLGIEQFDGVVGGHTVGYNFVSDFAPRAATLLT